MTLSGKKARLSRPLAALFGWGLLLVNACALAEYPERPVRFVIPFTTGGGADVLGRAVAAKLAEALGKNFIADNRPGAGAALGADLVAKSPADGYTLLIGTSGEMTIVPVLYPRTPYDPAADFWPVAMIGTAPNILIANPKLPVQDVRDLIAYAKTVPGKLTFGSGGTGTAPHLAGEVFKSITGIPMTHVPYKGSGPAQTDLVGGHVDLVFSTVAAATPLIKGNRVRAIGVTSSKRWPQLPEVPTLAEQGLPGYEVVIWYALFVPAKTPKEVVEVLRAAMDKILSDKDMRIRFEGLGVEAGSTDLGGAVLQQRITKEIAAWRRVIKDTGIKTE